MEVPSIRIRGWSKPTLDQERMQALRGSPSSPSFHDITASTRYVLNRNNMFGYHLWLSMAGGNESSIGALTVQVSSEATGLRAGVSVCCHRI